MLKYLIMTNTTNDWKPIQATELNVDKDFIYTKPKINTSGGKSVGIINTTSKKGLYLSTPLMLTWGINEYLDEQTGKRTYDMSLQFPKEEYNTESCQKFLENMKSFETKLKADAIKNSKEWMNKPKLTAEVCDALWTPMLKYPKYPEGHENSGEFDYTRAPTLRLKIPYWEGEYKFELYDTQSKLIFPNDKGILPTELVPKTIDIATVILCGGLWFANGKFGVTWKLFQGVVKPKASMKGKCLVQLSDAERVVLEQMDTLEESSVGVKLTCDTDDEEQEQEPELEPEPELEQEQEQELEPDPDPEPEPTPVVKKKVIRKKPSS